MVLLIEVYISTPNVYILAEEHRHDLETKWFPPEAPENYIHLLL